MFSAARGLRRCLQSATLLVLLLSSAPHRTTCQPGPDGHQMHTAGQHFGWRALRSAIRAHIKPHLSATHKVTLVTAFFDLGSRSKHKPTEYTQWIGNFFPKVATPMVVFTSESLVSNLRELRGSLPAVFDAYSSVWDLPPAAHYHAALMDQVSLDPEKGMHYPELYAIWSSKVWFMMAAAAHNPFSSQYFVWVDAGVFRGRSFPHWPSVGKLDRVFESCGRDDCVLLSDVAQSANSDETDWGAHWAIDPVPHVAFHGRDKIEGLRDYLQAAVFAAKPPGVLWWGVEYYALMHDYIRNGVFAGKEQNVFDALMVRNFWRVALLPERRLRRACGMDIYLAFQGALADKGESGCDIQLERYQGRLEMNRTRAILPPESKR